MSAKAIVIPGVTFYECKLAGQIGLCKNNPDGYFLFPSVPPSQSYLVVVANGYKSYIQPVTINNENQQFIVGGNSTAPNDVNLPPLSFNKPSRDRILNVMANLCNIEDATGLVIFEPQINYLILNDRLRADDWCARLIGAGSTHITTDITGDYDEILPYLGTRYPVPGGDYTNNLGDFKRILDYLLSKSLIPIVKSGADGQAYQPGGKTYGWSWGMQSLPKIYDYLIDYNDYVLWSTGYDGCFPDWSPEQLLSFLKMMRNSGLLYIDTEFGSGPGESISYCHLGNGANDWTDDKLGDLDSFSCELQTFPQDENQVNQQIEGMKEVWNRIGPGGMYRHNDKTVVGMYETTAYWSIRKYASSEQNKMTSKRALDVGFKTFGNGLP